MSLIIPANSASAAGGYDVDNSFRSNPGSSPRLHINALGTATDIDKWTFSCWFKRSKLSSTQNLLYAYTSGQEAAILLNSDDKLDWYNYPGGGAGQIITNRLFRDVSAWYHLVCSYDGDNGTAGNRMRIYINGVEETSFATDTNPSSGEDQLINSNVAHNIGLKFSDEIQHNFDGYLSEVVLIDGQQLDPTSFGEFDEDSGIWKPIDVSGLTFGDNGFYLDFEDSAALGDDVSGNGKDFTSTNIAATNQSTDTPTNNFCTFMSHTSGGYATLSEGGLISTGNSASDNGSSIASMGITNGKWYWEFEFDTQNSGYGLSGAIDTTAANFGIQGGAIGYPVPNAYMISVGGNMSDGGVSDEESGWASDYSNGDVLGMAFDMDNGAWYMHLNGTYYDSGDPTSAGSKTGAVVGWTPNGKTLVPIVTSYNGSIEKFNFGSPPYAISSGNTDGNGYGNFEYAVPSGYYALCTKNLSEFG